ncbi:MAG: DUF4177 domain-containing protein [Oscillospiraceae bacterium]|nr:DUF4177 domain-containing protein [Oscillospiraceae bacterium]
MYECQYVTFHVGGGVFIDNRACKHRAVIDEYAAQGWRYAGYIPTRFTGNGGSEEIDLIFERHRGED